MAAELFAVGGSKIYIGSLTVAKDEITGADILNEIWTEIGGWTQAGSIGDTQELITQKVIGSKRVRKAKGTLDAGNMENTFIPDASDLGQIKFKRAIESCKAAKFRIDWGAGCLPTGDFIATADDETFDSPMHGLAAGQVVVLSNTGGALPAGLTAGTRYYVLASGFTDDAFQLGLTATGAAIAPTTGGTGVQSFEAEVSGQSDYFIGLAMSGQRQGGDADTAQLRTWSIAITSNILEA